MKRSLVVVLLLVTSTTVVAMSMSSGSKPTQTFVEPTEENPWPVYGQDPGRHRVPDHGSERSVDLSAYHEVWNISGHRNTDAEMYAHDTVADVDADGDLEVVLTTGVFYIRPEGDIIVAEHDGTVLWNVSLQGAVGPPVVADLDGDPGREIYVSYGERHGVWEPNGSQRWEAETMKESGHSTSHALPVDVDGDGAFEILQSTEVGSRWERNLVEKQRTQRPTIHLFDGEDGEILASHDLPCGIYTTQLVGGHLGGTATLFVGSVHFRPNDGIGEPCSRIQALQIHEEEGSFLRELLGIGGLETRYTFETVWSHTIRNDTLELQEMLRADVAPAEGEELVIVWRGHGDEVGNGFTALTQSGHLAFEHRVPGWDVRGVTLSASDLGGDGLDEIAMDWGGHNAAWSPRVDGVEEHWLIRSGPDRNPTGTISSADLDGDGEPETILGWNYLNASRSSSLEIRSGTTVEWSWNFSEGAPIRNAITVDLDADGVLEILQPKADRYAVFDTEA